MKIALDVTQAKEFEAVPAGYYSVVVQKVEPRTSQAGNPCLSLDLQITEGEYAGRHLFYILPLVKEADWRVKSLLEAAGVPYGPDGFDSDDLLGRELVVKVRVEVYEGTETNRISAFRPEAKSSK